uniref:Pherophorin domain-containing protein n=1 Tax=Tetradesmus obliquus TaxID=3088 RepID=A0A383WPC6_TETOB|eukprot:jgi/Sobl393_1/4683/SZX79310.1
MKAIIPLLLAVALSSCLLCPASAQDVEAAHWGGKPGKPHNPPQNCQPEAPFNAKTFDWASVYTAYPVNNVVGTGILLNMVDLFTCSAPYALCAYANCTIVEGTNPPVAECGCQVSSATLGRGALSIGTTPTILDKNLQTATAQRCGSSIGLTYSICTNPPNQAPFCPLMRRNRCGKASMYGGVFDVISTFNTSTWPSGITSPQGGSGPGFKYCTKGCATNCFAAACHLKTAWNGMPATCYCPVYCQPGFIMSSNSTGYECEGQSVNGKLTYIQNGI